MKILHITASYKPAFIYGGPIYSVAALCEALEAEGEKLKAERANEVEEVEGGRRKAEGDSEVRSEKYKVKSGSNLSAIDNLPRSADYGRKTAKIQVYTTLANGNEELPYPNAHTEIIDGVLVTYFKRITKDHSHLSPALLSHLWSNVKKFDVVHIHSWWNLVSMGAVIVCLLRGVKPILSPRGMLGDYTFSKLKLLFHKLIGRNLLKKCNFHATTSMEAAEVLKQVFSGDDNFDVVDLMKEREEHRIKSKETTQQPENNKIFIIHNLVKLPEQLPTKTRFFDGTLKLIFLSRIHHKKGIELLLDTLAQINFPFHLSIVGEGELAYIESLKLKAKSNKLDERIDWVGPVYGEEKYQLLADHDVFILPSYNENFANVVIEAIAVGTPVLLSEHVGLQDYVKANDFGLVFKLEELKVKLEEAYSLFAENKLYFNNGLAILQEPLKVKYLEMYAEASNTQG